ncbi:MAG: hypothetical protein ACI8VC_002083 [Candidatus Endobugula sp.]|jgi:hypothetical protein
MQETRFLADIRLITLASSFLAISSWLRSVFFVDNSNLSIYEFKNDFFYLDLRYSELKTANQ